jgi:hypothetical protein
MRFVVCAFCDSGGGGLESWMCVGRGTGGTFLAGALLSFLFLRSPLRNFVWGAVVVVVVVIVVVIVVNVGHVGDAPALI